MGTDMKSLRTRIKSVSSTLHLTKAMGLVASSKIRKASDAMIKGNQYSAAMQEAMNLLTCDAECAKSPYLRQTLGQKTKLIVIAGDRGLAGGYNANVFRAVRDFPSAEFIPIGKRAFDRFGGELHYAESFSRFDAGKMAKELCRAFYEDEFDRLGIIWTKYESMMSQTVQVSWILPLQRSGQRSLGVVFEPDELQILHLAVPEYVAGRMMAAVRESFACEVAARRMAMDSAGKNAQQMIDDLQLQYNRARQGAITQEITEIVAGSGAEE